MSSFHITQKALKTEENKELEKTNSENAHWQWFGDNGWIDYDDYQSNLIEESFSKHLKVIEIDEERFIDFATMRQRRIDNPSKCRRIQRIANHTNTSNFTTPQIVKKPNPIVVPSAKPIPVSNVINTPTTTIPTTATTTKTNQPNGVVTKHNFLHNIDIPKSTVIPTKPISVQPSSTSVPAKKTNTFTSLFKAKVNITPSTAKPNIIKTQFTQTNYLPTNTQAEIPSKREVKETKEIKEENSDDDIDIEGVLELFEKEEQEEKKKDNQQKIKFQYDNKLIEQFHSVQKLSKFVIGNQLDFKKKQTLSPKQIFNGDVIYFVGDLDDNLKIACLNNGADFKINLTPLVTLIIANNNNVVDGNILLWASTKNVPIVNVDWLNDCLKQSKRFSFDNYLIGKEELNEKRKHTVDFDDDVIRLF